MKLHARGMTVGLAGMALLLGALVSPGTADDKDAKGVPKDILDGVLKVAGDLDKGKADDAKKDAAALKAKDLKFSMRLFKLRKNHGFGVGSKAGAIDPDGIERKIEDLAEKAPTPADLAKEAAAIQEAGYRIAAIATVAEAKAPAKDDGKKKVKDWLKWSKDMQAAGLELAKAKKGADIQTAAKKAQDACTACHDVFRDE